MNEWIHEHKSACNLEEQQIGFSVTAIGWLIVVTDVISKIFPYL